MNDNACVCLSLLSAKLDVTSTGDSWRGRESLQLAHYVFMVQIN